MTLTPWRDGDLVSASKLNSLIDMIDTATGLSEQRNYPFDAGANVLGCTGTYKRPARGFDSGTQVDYWVAHHGDRLVINFDGSTDAYFYWRKDESQLNAADRLLSPGTHTINLADTQFGIANLYPYQPCRIILRSTQHPADTLFVNYIYQTDSNAPTTLGTMPDFTNGATSAAANLNTVLNATNVATKSLGQPVACQYSNNDRVGTRNYWRGYIQHRHKALLIDLTVTAGQWDSNDFFYIRYNNTHVWSTGQNFDGVAFADLDLGLTVGNWYLIELGFERSAEHEQHVQVWSMAEQPLTSTFTAINRWTHGDVLYGDGGGTPYLSEMSGVLDDLSGVLRWVNLPCRTAGTLILDKNNMSCTGDQLIDTMSSTRVHRWLAYNSFRKANGDYANPQLHWFSQGRTMQPYSLPRVEAPAFFDLESTPVKPGMWFRLSGVGFGIQTPQPGINYA